MSHTTTNQSDSLGLLLFLFLFLLLPLLLLLALALALVLYIFGGRVCHGYVVFVGVWKCWLVRGRGLIHDSILILFCGGLDRCFLFGL